MKLTKVLAHHFHEPELLEIKESMKAILDQVNIRNDLKNQCDEQKVYVNQSQGRNLRKCKYFSRGFCKQRETCQFIHPKSICESFLLESKCYSKNCPFRHPKNCRYWKNSPEGCKRGSLCQYLHRDHIVMSSSGATENTNQQKKLNLKIFSFLVTTVISKLKIQLLNENTFSHKSHLNGFSLEWIILCLVK